ncbi:MAG: InlB B-repeat-containing protein [Planctomycetota bacterium]|jgi:PKD repeat protein
MRLSSSIFFSFALSLVFLPLCGCDVTLIEMPDEAAGANDTGGGENEDPGGQPSLPQDSAPQPVFSISHEVVIPGEVVRFDASASTDAEGGIAEFAWDFGDGATSADIDPEHTFEEPGEYVITLTVIDEEGAQSSTSAIVLVEEDQSDAPDELDQFMLDVVVDPPAAGSVVREPAGDTYDDGTVVTVTAEPNEGYRFVGFDQQVGEAVSIDVVMNQDRQLVAQFERLQFVVTATVDPPEAGTIILEPPGGAYDYGTSVDVSLEIRDGFLFDAYTDSGGSLITIEQNFSLDIVDDTTIVAVLHREEEPPRPPPPPRYTLDVEIVPADGGTVTLDPAAASYVAGTEVTLSALAAPGYEFVEYTGDATGTTTELTETMNGDKAVTALFAWLPAIGNSGNLLVSGFVGKNISEFDRFDGMALGEIVSSDATNLTFAGGVDFGPGGDLYVVNVGVLTDTSVRRFDGRTGEDKGTFVTGPGGVGFLTLRFGPSGHLYIPNSTNDAIGEYDGETGSFIQEFVTSGSGGLDNPVGLAFDAAGDLFVVSENNDRILRYDGSTGDAARVVVDLAALGFLTPVDVTFGPQGNLYVSLSGDDSVALVDAAAGTATTFVSSQAGGLDTPGGLIFHPESGNLLVVSQGSNEVLAYDGLTGEFIEVFATGADGDSLFFMAIRP